MGRPEGRGSQVNFCETGMACPPVSWGGECPGAALGSLLDPLALGGCWALSILKYHPLCSGSSRLAVYKGIRCQWEVSVGWDRGGGLPGGNKLGKSGRLFLAAWPGNCLWVSPDLALPRCKLLAVNSVNSRVSTAKTVSSPWVPVPPLRGGHSNSPDGKVVCLWKQMSIESPERERWEPRGYFEDMASFSCPFILFTARFCGHLSSSPYFLLL